jgi:hypothetical protein
LGEPGPFVARITFEVSRSLNHFCHVSVLYSDTLPAELADGMLGNKAYQEKNTRLRREKVLRALREAEPVRAGSWYSLARQLMRTPSLKDAESGLNVSGGLQVMLGQLREEDRDFDEIWDKTATRLEEYRAKFQAIWSPISDRVLTSLSSLSKEEWAIDEIRVHFVDCLWGGFAWVDSIAFTPFPDMEVQKKFLTHELSELITPGHVVATKLKEAGLNPGITHTVVDMLAYFSVRDFIEKPVFPHPERRGIRPNQDYYPAVDELYPLTENYAQDPSASKSFDAFIGEVVSRLKAAKPAEVTV